MHQENSGGRHRRRHGRRLVARGDRGEERPLRLPGLAGIRPDAPGFARVRLAPAPGELKEIRATVPHPDGKIAVDLHFEDGAVRGSVETPVPGVFVWQGREAPLIPGSNNL